MLSARARAAKLLEFTYEVDCSGITLEAELDFDYLLSLEKQADLRLLDDFCTATFRATDPKQPPFTRVQLRRLREFVVRDLSAPRAKGKARNIVFKSGKEQFFWRLSRTSPIRDEVPSELEWAAVRKVNQLQAEADLPELIVIRGALSRRSLWLGPSIFRRTRLRIKPSFRWTSTKAGST